MERALTLSLRHATGQPLVPAAPLNPSAVQIPPYRIMFVSFGYNHKSPYESFRYIARGGSRDSDGP